MAKKKKELVPYIFEHEKFGKIRAITIDGEPWFVGRDIATVLGYTNSRKALIDHVPAKFKRVINAKTLQQMASQSKGNETHTFENAEFSQQMASQSKGNETHTFENAEFPQQMASQSKGGETHTFENAEWEFDSPRGLTFIKEQGLYRLILRSELPAAEEFTDWACEVLVSIRKTGSYSVPQQKKKKELPPLPPGIFNDDPTDFGNLARLEMFLEENGIEYDYDVKLRVIKDENGNESLCYSFEPVIKNY